MQWQCQGRASLYFCSEEYVQESKYILRLFTFGDVIQLRTVPEQNGGHKNARFESHLYW